MTHQEYKALYIKRMDKLRKVCYYLGLIKLKSYADERDFILTVETSLRLYHPLVWVTVILSWIFHSVAGSIKIAAGIAKEITQTNTETQTNWDKNKKNKG